MESAHQGNFWGVWNWLAIAFSSQCHLWKAIAKPTFGASEIGSRSLFLPSATYGKRSQNRFLEHLELARDRFVFPVPLLESDRFRRFLGCLELARDRFVFPVQLMESDRMLF